MDNVCVCAVCASRSFRHMISSWPLIQPSVKLSLFPDSYPSLSLSPSSSSSSSSSLLCMSWGIFQLVRHYANPYAFTMFLLLFLSFFFSPVDCHSVPWQTDTAFFPSFPSCFWQRIFLLTSSLAWKYFERVGSAIHRFNSKMCVCVSSFRNREKARKRLGVCLAECESRSIDGQISLSPPVANMRVYYYVWLTHRQKVVAARRCLRFVSKPYTSCCCSCFLHVMLCTTSYSTGSLHPFCIGKSLAWIWS